MLQRISQVMVMEAAGSVLTNMRKDILEKILRSCEVVDVVEQIAIELKNYLALNMPMCSHSGSQANTAVFFACLKPEIRFLVLIYPMVDITHGSPVNFSGRLYTPSFYGVERETGRLDYDKIQEIALKEQPKMIIAGASAYSRDMDFERFRVIADSVGAILLADISHPSGLIAKVVK
jgi:glycine hydroxymethyltransferase